jgi:hypothetical protein
MNNPNKQSIIYPLKIQEYGHFYKRIFERLCGWQKQSSSLINDAKGFR